MRGRSGGLGDLPAAAEIAIQQPTALEPLQRLVVVGHVLGLTADGPFPAQTQPGEILQDRRLVFGAAAGAVDVLDTQNEPAARGPGRLPGGQGGKGVPAMEPARGGGGEPGGEGRHARY